MGERGQDRYSEGGAFLKMLAGLPAVKRKEHFIMNIQREIKAYIVREGLSMREVVERLSITHKWSKSLSNFSGKLQRGTLRYKEAEEVAERTGTGVGGNGDGSRKGVVWVPRRQRWDRGEGTALQKKKKNVAKR